LKEYRRIADKNIFFDPPAPPVKAEPKVVVGKKEEPVKEREADLAPYLYLTRISHSDGKGTALVFDRLRKQDYEIEIIPGGKVKVTRYWYSRVDEANGAVGEVRKKLDESPYLQFGSKDTGNLRRYNVRRILESELVLEPVDEARELLLKSAAPLVLGGSVGLVLPPKQLGVWRVGQSLTNEDPKRAMRDVSYTWEKRELLSRPLMIDNETEATTNLDGSGTESPQTPMPMKKRRN